MHERTFHPEDQIAFAQLSGDWNPLHVDQVYARRCLTGQAVVHGIHASLWALDTWLSEFGQQVSIRSLKASFLRPMPVGVALTCSVIPKQDDRVDIEIFCARSVASKLEVEWIKGGRGSGAQPTAGFPERKLPLELSLEEIAGHSGTLALQLDLETASGLFPRLVRFLPPDELAAIVNTSRLVGVECPGLHSLFSEIDLVAAAGQPRPLLGYQVTQVDSRFGLVRMHIETPALAGDVRAFLRPKPTAQAGYSTLQAQVQPGEFAGQKALIVGGSRGLGELVAKMLAAGGAEVRITYHRGESDAARIVEDIAAHGGKVGSMKLDVLDRGNEETPLPDDLAPTHLYYFATPFIFSGTRACFSEELFARFCDYYVTGFGRTVERLTDQGLKRVFYPSSVAIEELPLDMGEYVTAKAAGETLCALLEKRHGGLKISRPRLPRMATDQTASLLPVKNLDPLPVMLELMRAFHEPDSVCRTLPRIT